MEFVPQLTKKVSSNRCTSSIQEIEKALAEDSASEIEAIRGCLVRDRDVEEKQVVAGYVNKKRQATDRELGTGDWSCWKRRRKNDLQFMRKRRTSHIINKYCETESHCDDPSLCCHSNICVERGCFGCASDSDCSSGHVCCKKSFPFNQAFCAKDCVGQQCNDNDDCAVGTECCRDGKCINTQSQECFKVQNSSTCKTHADCKVNWVYKYCCGGDTHNIDRTTRRCGFSYCLDKYCETESHCGDPSLCCHSNICIDRGCSGCASDSECSSGHVCCKKSFRFNQGFCAKDCVGQQCNNNDDCAVRVECCRDGKCISAQSQECFKQCKSNSECESGKYCCKKKSVWFWQDRCTETCLGEVCIFDDDCGPPNECCIAGKCNHGCSRCASDSDCTAGLYCCKKRFPNEARRCLAHCTGKSCGTISDCGDQDEICNSNNICAMQETKQNYTDSSPPWHIAVIVIAALLIVVGIPMAIFWCYK
ncbi:Hypothetical predicted protein [Paramuricea clavata]|uniref:Uncharacterized protein n=1 Tax=Paramuricea clavata TaxID=317549 RepID=A0A7D9HRJ7_PARCT|nr:Hypothetical predicted protein [Paramuricea clavata]